MQFGQKHKGIWSGRYKWDFVGDLVIPSPHILAFSDPPITQY